MTTIKKPDDFQALETTTVLATFLLVISLFLHRSVLVHSALALLLIGLFLRPVSRIITRVWLKFSELVGSFSSKIVLSVVYFAVITPLAFLFRLFSKNPLQLKKETNANTLFSERNHLYTPEDFEKLW